MKTLYKMDLPEMIRAMKKFVIADAPDFIVFYENDSGDFDLNDGTEQQRRSLLGRSTFTADQVELIRCANPNSQIIKVIYETEIET